MAKKCTLCGGKLDSTKRCTLCGLDNTKNDEQYQGYLNRNNHDNVPLTHVHNEPSMHRYEYDQQGKAKPYDYAKKVQSQAKNFAEQYTSTVNKNRSALSKKEKERKPGKILGIIVVIMGIFPTIMGLITSFADNVFDEMNYWGVEEEYTIPDTAYEEWLPAGLHEVGVHIPAGTYNVILDWGNEGTVEVLDYVDGTMCSMEYFYLESGTEELIDSILLVEGEILKISPEIQVYLYSTDADPNTLYTEVNELTEHYSVGEEMMVAGQDFPAGVYDISYTSLGEAEMGTVTISIWNNEYQNTVLVDNLYFDDSYGDTLYCNIPFEAGSYIYVSGLRDVRLVPSWEVKEGYNFNETLLDDGNLENL